MPIGARLVGVVHTTCSTVCPAVVVIVCRPSFYKLARNGVASNKYCVVYHPLLLLAVAVCRIPTVVGLLCSTGSVPSVVAPPRLCLRLHLRLLLVELRLLVHLLHHLLLRDAFVGKLLLEMLVHACQLLIRCSDAVDG